MSAIQADLFAARARPATPQARVLSVSELTRELKGAIESRFARVAVRGEISNFKAASSGHLYFTLKDDGACIAAVLFRADAARLRFGLKDGLSVIALGRVSIYEARGQYQVICESLEPQGAGALALRFAELKTKLAEEGLFDPERKRPVPFLPHRIGVVTSTSGAAIRDFLRVLHDRFPIPVLIAPARVQGEGAAGEIASGIERLSASGLVDVIVVTRGGGSIEDLWAFNEEQVARAIAASRVPVVSAVGHEVDFTIADFVADKRCATPTDAAKTLAPPRQDLARALDQQRRHLTQIALTQIGLGRERLRHRAARLADPRRTIASERLALDHTAERLAHGMSRVLAGQTARLAALGERLNREHPRARLLRLSQSLALLRHRLEMSGRARLAPERVRLSKMAAGLESLSPLSVLGRGYSIAFMEGGRILRRAVDAPAGARVRLLLPDRSQIDAQVVDPSRRAH
jgi:exodeoxyribonuclease VII large subunit